MNKKIINNGLIFLTLLIVEVFIALFVRDRFIRPYVGDMIVVLVIYFFIQTIYPRRVKYLPIIIFSFATFVEVLQYINILGILGLSHITFLNVVVGTTFSWLDIICYAVGCGFLTIYEKKIYGGLK